MNLMQYKGYAARIEYSDEDGCLVGQVAGINDIIVFDGKSVGEARRAFHECIDGYLAACERLGHRPQKP